MPLLTGDHTGVGQRDGSKRGRAFGVVVLVQVVWLAACGPSNPPESPLPTSAAPPVQTEGPLFGDPIRFRPVDFEVAAGGVEVLHQDVLGFVWAGTQGGLVRFEGSEARVFEPVPFDTTTLRTPRVLGIVEGDEDSFWLATSSGGVHQYDARSESFVLRSDLAPDRLWSIVPDGEGGLWVGAAYEGLYRVSLETGQSEPFHADSSQGAALPSDRVRELLLGRDGTLWVGTDDGGLARRDPETGAFHTYRPIPGDPTSLPDPSIQALHQDSRGRIWVGTRGGVARYDSATDTFVRYTPDDGDPARRVVYALESDPAGTLWIGTEAGLDRLDPSTGAFQAFQHDSATPSSLSAGAVSALLLDRSGVFWVGTERGIVMFEWAPNAFWHLTHDPDDPNSLVDPDVWAIHEDEDGIVWVGTDEGLHRVDRAKGRVERLLPDASDPSRLASRLVMGIQPADSTSLWVASRPGGLHRVDRETGRVLIRYEPDLSRSGGLHSENPWWLLEDSQGRTWITSGGPGCLQRWDRATDVFTPFCHDPDDPDTPAADFARTLIEGRDGSLWLGTWGGGLDRIDPVTGTFTHYQYDPSDTSTPADDFILTIYEDNGGDLWLGTYGGGLSRLDPETGDITHVSTYNSDLPSNAIYGILPDGEHLWLSTDRGLARFDTSTDAIRVFGPADGVQALAFNSGAFYRSNSGELFFGGANGLTAFYPDEIRDGSGASLVALTEVAIDSEVSRWGQGEALDAAPPYARSVRLAPGQRDLTVSFTALDYAHPSRDTYRYRLEGYEGDWHETAEGNAVYTNLDPGRYTFVVEATDTGGVWGGPSRRLAVTVAPRWFQAWWFRLLAALALATAAVAAVRRRTRQTRERQAALEAEVADRTVALRERTDALEAEKATTEIQAERLREVERLRTQFFTNVSHEFRTPLTLTIGPLEDLERETLPEGARVSVDLALRNSRRLLRLTNQLLDAARLEAGEMTLRARPLDVGARVRDTALSFAPLAERRSVTFKVETPPGGLEVWADADKLDAILVNLLSNAFKFTPQGGAVTLSVLEGEGTAQIRVRDNGPGIAPDDLEYVFDRFYRVEETGGADGTGIGLSLARDLAVLHGGAIEAESIEGLGSVFTLTLPLGRDHLEDGQIAPAALEDEPLRLAVPVRDHDDATEPDDADDRTTVLVADDNADIRAYVRSHLKDRYRVLEAADGARALEVAREEMPDLIVSDIMMPGLDGVGLVRALRADAATDFIPVVLLTAKAEEADVQVGLDAGADAYVVKPFNAQTLQARIDNLIASRQSLRVRFATSGDGLVSGTSDAADPVRSPFVTQARSVVEDQLSDDDFSVADFADALDITRSTLHRRLKSETGTTPSAFIRAIRLEHARRLLEDGAGTVSEVAYAVGFRSVSHFSRTFSTRYEVTPSSVGRGNAVGE